VGSTPAWRIFCPPENRPKQGLTKEDRIKFNCRTNGLFDIIAPEIGGGEIFDSNQLRETIFSLIEQGRRNFAINLSSLDYVYSDAINALLTINKRVLDVSGRLTILSPTPQVIQILERTGITNILKIYSTEDELLASSEDIIRQTASFSLRDIRTYLESRKTEGPKKSEFDALRSELETEIGKSGFAAPSAAPTPPVYEGETGRDFAPSPGRAPQQDFFTAPPPQQPMWTEVPAAGPSMPGQAFEGFPSVSAPPKGYDFAPPPAPPPPPPQKPAAFEPPDFARQAPAIEKEPVAAKPPRPKRGIGRDLDEFDSRYGDEEFLEEKKKSMLPAVLVIVVLLIVAVGGILGYIAYKPLINKGLSFFGIGPKPSALSGPEQSIPQVPVAQPEVKETAAEEPAAPEEKAPEVATTAKVQKVREEKPKPAPAPTPRRTTSTSSSRREVSRPAPKPAPPPPAVSQANKLVVTSNPSQASIKINGKPIGMTPFAWDNPNIYGAIALSVSKPGYKETTREIEFTGGSQSEFFALEAEETPAPPPEEKPVYTPSTPSSVIPAEEPPKPAAPAPPPPAPVPTIAAAPPASSGPTGEPAKVFISSIPPVADVYLDGKLIGKTNITKLNVFSGTHTVRLVKGTKEISKTMTFKAGDNPAVHIQF
jgi:anti-anti-sigma factor